MTPLLTTENLTRRFASRLGVEALSLSLGPGDIVGLAGLNGAGKSTTLAMMAGVLRPTRGQVLVGGRSIVRDRRARRLVGFAPDRAPLYPELTVREYLDFSAALNGLSGDGMKQAVVQVMERTRLAGVQRRLIRTLSRGYQQRVGLAQALVHHPEVLLLDEPTDGLDPQQTAHFRELVRDQAGHGAVLLSTHQMDVIAGLCNRLLILHDGRLVTDMALDDEPSAHLQALFAEFTGTEAP